MLKKEEEVICCFQASIQPGGSVTFEHRNIKGLNRSAVGSVTSSNLLNPQVFWYYVLEILDFAICMCFYVLHVHAHAVLILKFCGHYIHEHLYMSVCVCLYTLMLHGHGKACALHTDTM